MCRERFFVMRLLEKAILVENKSNGTVIVRRSEKKLEPVRLFNIMNISPMIRRSAAPLLAAALTTSATAGPAQAVRVFDPPSEGHARPPLWQNVQPAASVYYTPAQIQAAYGFNSLYSTTSGTGRTIAIIDAYGSPTLQSDLNAFCTEFGLPATTPIIAYPQGVPGGNTGWAEETTLDVEWAHAIAPGATILLVVAANSSYSDLLGAVDYAVSHGANVVSMSWGGSESSAETGKTGYDSHFDVPGVTFVASSGDSGAGVEYPAASPYVVGVGGTTLTLNATTGIWSETAWSDSGGGLSAYESFPNFQTGWNTFSSSERGVPDVAYVADPNTGVLVYYNGGWWVFGGTSVGAPQWSALVALSSYSPSGSFNGANPELYGLAGASDKSTTYAEYYFDITSGSDGSGTDDKAVTGYDLVTGLGAPQANNLVPALGPPSPDFSVSVTPSTQTVAPGSPVSYAITIASLDGFSGTVSLSAVGYPNDASDVSQPAPVSGGSGSASLTFTTSAADSGTYTITITGTSTGTGGTLTHTAKVTLVVATPGFSLSASPASQTVRHGNSTSYTVSVSPLGGFTGTVALSASGLPSGATATFTPASISTSGSSTLTVKTGSTTSRGTYTLTITGKSTSPVLTHTTTVSLTVN